MSQDVSKWLTANILGGAAQTLLKKNLRTKVDAKENIITKTQANKNQGDSSKLKSAGTGNRKAQVLVFGQEDLVIESIIFSQYAKNWQRESRDPKAVVETLATDQGPMILVNLGRVSEEKSNFVRGESPRLEVSDYAKARDTVGAISLKSEKVVEYLFYKTNTQQDLGALVGVGLGGYSFRNIMELKKENSIQNTFFKLQTVKNAGKKTVADILENKKEIDLTTLFRAQVISKSINLARHLVNLPGNILHPMSFVDEVKHIFQNSENTSVEIWDAKRLASEKMNLHLAVGQGASHGPHLVVLRYRGRKKKKPSLNSVLDLAIVGKGVTFDSGGLDIKPSSAMRIMKKDMGGAAAALGFAYYLDQTDCDYNCDIYLALAENSVDQKSFRPGDIFVSRKGVSVEIHNTDAEGRLVMADALAIASESKPKMLIDIATLTGAIKVALGSEIAGLFCNDENLAHRMEKAGRRAGELNWRMPLYAGYRGQLHSHFADIANSADGFGGAITAALFLEKFVEKTPWAHLDIYAWTDKPSGALTSAGGSGQGVQTLIEIAFDSV